jgi:response regulator RpfG family c-di-GMP phosphodiesterase
MMKKNRRFPSVAKKPRVVFLDDEKNILAAVKRLLRDEPFGVIVTASAKEAVEAIRHYPIATVLADQRMPEISGVEFLKKVRVEFPRVTRILFTGYADPKVLQQAVNQDEVYRIIFKPWNNRELKKMIREAIDRFDDANAVWGKEFEIRIL